MCILRIDTTNNTVTTVSLEIKGHHLEKTSDSRVYRSQVTLPLIESLLQEAGIQISDITDIHIATGPGSFTGVRVGISIANALSLLYNIPINGKHDLAKAIY